MLKVINADSQIFFGVFKGLQKEGNIEAAIEEAILLIEETFLKLLENITVYPSFCNKKKLAEKIVQKLIREIQENKNNIKEEIEKRFKKKDLIKSIIDYITEFLEKEEKEAEKKTTAYSDYILESDFPIDFLDDMMMAHHYIGKYYHICRKLIMGLRPQYTAMYRSHRYRPNQLTKKIAAEAYAYLEDLNELLNLVQTIELFITIWSAKSYEEIIEGKVELSFRRISENEKANREFQRFSWELKAVIKKVRMSGVILDHMDLYKNPLHTGEAERALWDDLLLSMNYNAS